MNDFTATSGAAIPPRPLGDEGALFARYHDRLLRSVSGTVHTSRQNIEDACSHAWTQLLRTQPERREQLFAWLRIVAIREAIKLDQVTRRDTSPDEAHQEAPCPDVGDQVEARDALRLVASLPARQRDVLSLHVAGYDYEQIGTITATTRRSVERHMMRARRTIRSLSH